jgi:hypothetical protein
MHSGNVGDANAVTEGDNAAVAAAWGELEVEDGRDDSGQWTAQLQLMT